MDTTIDLPVYWASAIINGDDSGLNDWDVEHMNAEITAIADAGMIVVDVSEDTFFGRYGGLGCDMATYTLIER